MKRIVMLLSVVALMAVMLAMWVGSAFAADSHASSNWRLNASEKVPAQGDPAYSICHFGHPGQQGDAQDHGPQC